MWCVLQADNLDDFVLATGKGYSIKDFLEMAFGHVGLEWQKCVKFDERYLRPTEVDALVGDPSKAQETLGGTPTIDGKELAKLMVDADIEALEHAGSPWIDAVKLGSWSAA